MLKHALYCARESLKAKTSFMLFLENKTKVVNDEGYNIVFHYFDTKNYIHHDGVEVHKENDPLLPPYPKFRQVAHIRNGADHYAFINLYQTSLGHVVISSADPLAKQIEPLNKQDCSALSQVIRGYERKGIAYFNFGLESGCSQMHKHMQFTTLQYNPLFKAMCNNANLGIKYYSLKLRDDSPNEIYDGYNELLKKAHWDKSYNFVISEGYACLVPRRFSVHPYGLSLNSLGVSGHYFVWEGKSEKAEKEPLKVLRDLCVPTTIQRI